VIPFAFVFDGHFFRGEHLRWNLDWPTPNYAGAFLVTLLCFAWIPGKSVLWRAALVTGEATGYFLLANTYSRGATIAFGSAAVYFVIAQGWAQWWVTWRIWMLRFLLFTGCVIGTGLSSRLIPKTLSADGAVTHRLELWRGGLEMVAAAPLRGWGAGESGRAYMNWFQDVDRNEGFTTMVNSYLHVGVEHGLAILGGAVFGLAGLLVLAWQISRLGEPCRDGMKGTETQPSCVGAIQWFDPTSV
jgi:O-antigen ligase